jgi:hypothetical protein
LITIKTHLLGELIIDRAIAEIECSEEEMDAIRNAEMDDQNSESQQSDDLIMQDVRLLSISTYCITEMHPRYLIIRHFRRSQDSDCDVHFIYLV